MSNGANGENIVLNALASAAPDMTVTLLHVCCRKKKTESDELLPIKPSDIPPEPGPPAFVIDTMNEFIRQGWNYTRGRSSFTRPQLETTLGEANVKHIPAALRVFSRHWKVDFISGFYYFTPRQNDADSIGGK